MHYENQDWEISLKDMVFSVLYQWKRILVVALVLAVVLGGYKGYGSWRSANDPESLAQAQEAYAEELAVYEQELASLERSVEQLENAIASENEYLTESPLMQMDYHNVYKASVSLYFSTGYQIMPQMSYQNVDTTKSVVSLYKAALESNGIMDAVAGEVGIEAKYLHELVTVVKDSDYILQIEVIHEDKDTASKIVELMLDNLSSTQSQVTETVGEHTMAVVLNTAASSVELDVAETQDTEKAKLETYMTTYDNTVTELKALGDPPVMAASNSNAVKTAVKWAVLGGVAGVLVYAVAACVLFLLGGAVHSGEEMKKRLQIKVLGSVIRGKKRPDGVTRWIKQLEGRLDTNSDTNLEMLAANIHSYAGGAKTLLVTGDANIQDTQLLAENLRQKLGDITLTACGSLLRDPEALRQLHVCDGVLLVEVCGKSKYQNIIHELERVTDASKPIVGCITVD